jgi:YVTN family beta-propeller protein
MVYVANQLSDNISIINGSSGTILNNVTLQGGRPIEICNNFNKHIYVPNGFKNSVDVIDGQTNQVIKSIDVGRICPGNCMCFVTQYES